MRISRVKIKNFRNFQHVDVELAQNIVIVGENRSGKSNFIHALRLVLDTSLPERARQLRRSDFWDGLSNPYSDGGHVIEIDIDFVGFEADEDTHAQLGDFRVAEDHTVARLSYRFRPTSNKEPICEADYDYVIFGGGDETKSVPPRVRRRIVLDVLGALRDAEGDLGNWQKSPLRPLVDHAFEEIDDDDLESIAADIRKAGETLVELPQVAELQQTLREKLVALSGKRHDIDAKFGVTSTDPSKLSRILKLYIDGGIREIGDASLGSANLALLTLRLAEYEWRRAQNVQDFNMIAIEEPEAHLHPQLQRKVFSTLFAAPDDNAQSLILTTHSPNIASVAPFNQIVLVRETENGDCSIRSLASLELSAQEREDLQGYLDTARAEILFARGIIFVEGPAEEALLPAFAKALGHDLDDLGITVCSVGGVNFRPYVRLAVMLGIPMCVLTDWDPINAEEPLGRKRAIDLILDIRNIRKMKLATDAQVEELRANDEKLRTAAAKHNFFLNNSTLETEMAAEPDLADAILTVLEDQQAFGKVLRKRIATYKEDHSTISPERLMLMIGYVSKGRFARQLSNRLHGVSPPEYIAAAIQSIVERVE